MKVSLVVQTPGKAEGKIIPIAVSPFFIGRDPKCHLRPASVLVSKKHCGLLIRDGKVFLHDFSSTNGTLVNDQPVKGEIELRNEDQLRIGSLAFGVRIATGLGVDQPTPLPPTKVPAASADDEAAAALLSGLDEPATTGSIGVDEQGVPTGDTVMEKLPALGSPGPATASAGAAKSGSKPGTAKPPSGDTSTAAKAILDKYLRRPRESP